MKFSLQVLIYKYTKMKGNISVQMDTECGLVTQLPIVEDGLSSGHASDTDNNNQLRQVSLYLSKTNSGQYPI